MGRKSGFDALLENNTVLMVLSLFIAVLVWFTVVWGTGETTELSVRNVPVQVDLEDSALARLGLDPVTESNFSVDVEIVGPRAVVGGVKVGDIQIVAKLHNVNGPGTYTLALEGADIKEKGFEIKNIVPETVSMRFDHMITRSMPINLELQGLEIPDEYLLDQEFLTPSEVTVSGPATEMALVASGEVRLSFDKPLTQTGTFESAVLLLDANGNPIESPYLVVDQPVASVTLPVLKKKTVPVTFDFTNVPPGFDVDSLGYFTDPETVEIAGPSASINGFTELHLGYIDLRGLEPDAVKTYNVSLPPGYLTVENIQEVDVVFENPGYTSRRLSTSDIRLINQPPDYNVEISTKTIYDVMVYGPEEEIEQITGKDLIAQIDMTDVDIRIGQATVPVSILIPGSDECWVYGGDKTAVVTIQSK